MDRLLALLKVEVDFETSHLLFPTIIEWVLLALGLAIVATHGRRWAAAWREAAPVERRRWPVDTRRLVGCLVLTVVYFAAMEPVGAAVRPNSGIGFLLTSWAYVFALSWLFVRERTRRKTVAMTLNALVTPTLVWLVFAHLFRITLP